MSELEMEELVRAIEKRWPATTSGKVQRYVDKFFDATRLGTKVSAQVVTKNFSLWISLPDYDMEIIRLNKNVVGTLKDSKRIDGKIDG